MTASSRGSRAAASLIRSPRVCSDCINSITRSSPPFATRSYATAATAETSVKVDAGTAGVREFNKWETPYSTPEYNIKAGVVLSRPPLLTRVPTQFEKAFFFYQKRLNERLAMPFTRYFYFKPDTPADHDWKLKVKERGGAPSHELGGYRAYGDMAWNDEILVGDKTSEPSHTVESLLRDAEMRVVEGKDGELSLLEAGQVGDAAKADKPLARWTEADAKRDTKRLDRKLARTLYLLVKRENGGWGFPSGLVLRENLHQAAERVLVQTGGVNMNTWIVGHAPVGHHITKPRYAPDSSIQTPGEKTFFMKGRIMAGQANLTDNKFGLSDFKWLTKEEVEKHVAAKYFSSIGNMLADR